MINYNVLDIARDMSACHSNTLEVAEDEFMNYLNSLSNAAANVYFKVNEVYQIKDGFRSNDYVVRNLECSIEDDGIMCTLDEDCKMLEKNCLLSGLVVDSLRFFIFSDERLANDILEIVTEKGHLIIIQTMFE